MVFGPSNIILHYQYFQVWAPGEPPLVLPDYLGGPLFGDTGVNAFEIEIHYNNPGKSCQETGF